MSVNELKIFEHPQFGNIRTITENGKTLFCAKDVAIALGYKNTRDAINRHCKGVVKRDVVSLTTNQHGTTTEQMVEMAFIPEGDLYRLAAKSELPAADAFERWIFDDVLPTIRRTGGYFINGFMPTRPLTSDDYADAAKTISRCPGNRLLIVLDLYRRAGLDIQIPPMPSWMCSEQLDFFAAGKQPGM